jgi:phosphoglycolate phosphatase
MEEERFFLLFDFDLTIADSTNSTYFCANFALKKLGFPPSTKAKIKKTIGLSLEKTFITLTNDNNSGKGEKFSDFFIAKSELIALAKIKLFDGVLNTLKQLKELCYSLSIVSTKDKPTIERILERENIKHYFDCIIGLKEVKFQKPNPEGLLLAVEKLKANPKNCIYVGDSIVDAVSAQNAKIKFIAVLTGNYATHDFTPFEHIGILSSISELPHFLENLEV